MVRCARQPGGGRAAAVVSGSRRYRVVHCTSYHYAVSMVDGYTVAHVLPRNTPWQDVEVSDISIEPEPAEYDEFSDVFGNRVLQFGVHRPHDSLVVEAASEVVVSSRGEVGPGEPWEAVAGRVASLRGDEALEIGPFLGRSRFVDLERFGAPLHEIAAAAFTPGRPLVDATRALCHDIYESFVFDPTATDLSTPLGDVLTQRRGVCQDFAHLAAGCLRSFGLPARYVSGYLETTPPPGAAPLVGADVSHAWCSVWDPTVGWVDFDPTNDHLPVDRHVTVGWGRDFADVSPVRGVVIGPPAAQSLEVSVDVARLDEPTLALGADT